MTKKIPKIYLVIPCYNEAEVLPITNELFAAKLEELMTREVISEDSKVLYVNDGSKDSTWDIIHELSLKYTCVEGLKLSRNEGHQNALSAGLTYVMDKCDAAISMDCDGQDDINAIDEMIANYMNGYEVVYGVRNNRDTDTWFKRQTAELYYKIIQMLGADVVPNHADYRLLGSRVLEALASYQEVNLYLRGLVPLVGFNATNVYYKREERKAGTSKYPLKRMISLAVEGITSFSVKPLQIITLLGMFFAFVSLLGIIWVFYRYCTGHVVSGWSSTVCVILFMGGLQLICLGVIGEYIGKIYLEVKHRPKYIIEDCTEFDAESLTKRDSKI